MRLCTTLMFDGDPVRLAAQVRDLEAAGVDMVLIPEIYGFDQVYAGVGVTHLIVNPTGTKPLDDLAAVKAWIG